MKGYLCFTVCPLGWADISARRVQRVKESSGDATSTQGFVVAEKKVLFEVENYTVADGIVSL